MPFLINQLSVNFERARHVARSVTGNAKCGAHTSPSIARQVRSRQVVVMVEEAARFAHNPYGSDLPSAGESATPNRRARGCCA